MSFPSLGSSLSSINHTRRVTPRVRADASSGARGEAVTEWMHPQVKARMRREDEKERERVRRAKRGTAYLLDDENIRIPMATINPANAVDAASAAGDSSSSNNTSRAARGGKFISSNSSSSLATSDPSSTAATSSTSNVVSPLLTASYLLGTIISLNHKVGKIIYLGSLQSLEGTWVALLTYRAHGLGRRPVFDFSTVKHVRRGGVLTPIDPPDTVLTRVIGVENYTEQSGCEVDTYTLARAQREAMKIVSQMISTGDHAVFVRVEDVKKTSSTSQASSKGEMLREAKENTSSPPLLPTIAPRNSITAFPDNKIPPGSAASKKKPTKTGGKEKAPSAKGTLSSASQSPNSPARRLASSPSTSASSSTDTSPSAVTRKVDGSAAAAMEEMSLDEESDLTKAKKKNTAPHSSASTSSLHPPSHHHHALNSSASTSSLPIIHPSSLPPLTSESSIPPLAHQLHLTGPFAEVDTIALMTQRAQHETSLFTLSKYLTQYYTNVVNSEEKKARVLARWVMEHVEYDGSPLSDVLKPGEKIRMGEEVKSAAGDTPAAVATTTTQVTLVIPEEATNSESESSSLSSTVNKSVVPGVASSTTSSSQATTLASRASTYHRRDLGLGPSPHSRYYQRSRNRKGLGDAEQEKFDEVLKGYESSGDDGGEEEDEEEKKMEEEAMSVNINITPSSSSSATTISAESVLKSRRSSSYGFALLFQSLCAIAGLECLVVRGLRKFGPEVRKRVWMKDRTPNHTANNKTSKSLTTYSTSPSDHTPPITCYADWNIVKVNERWMIVDCFASAGVWSVAEENAFGGDDGAGTFIRSFSPCYFSPPPSTFLLTHYPLYIYKHTGIEYLLAQTQQPLLKQHVDGFLKAGLGGLRATVVKAQEANMIGTEKHAQQLQTQAQTTQHHTNLPSQLDRLTLNTSSQKALLALRTEYTSLLMTSKDPLTMSTLELMQHPRSLQLIQPPISKNEFDSTVSISRSYIHHSLETYETEYHIEYGINSLGSGIAGTTFQIELEVPVWMECGVEMVKMVAEEKKEAETGNGEEVAVEPSSKVESIAVQSASHTRGASSLGTGLPTEDSSTSSSFDLTTCWFAQKAVGTRIEIRQPAINSNPSLSSSSSTSNLQQAPPRYKKIHRTRLKVHLVFPQPGLYRVILYNKRFSEKVVSQLEKQSQQRKHADDITSGIALRHDDQREWEALIEYSITVNQGVVDLPKRRVFLNSSSAVVPTTTAATIPAESTSSSLTATTTSTITTPSLPPPRHLYVGFLQNYRPTFHIPSIRSLASQIVCVRPWTGYFELGCQFQLQYVTPKEVCEMIVVGDGKWSAMNEGGVGWMRSRYRSVQDDVLEAATVQPSDHSGLGGGTSTSSNAHKFKSSSTKAPTLSYAQDQDRNVFTLDWAMIRVPELFVYFRVMNSSEYYLLSYFRTDVRNHIREEQGDASVAAAPTNGAAASEKATATTTSLSPSTQHQHQPPSTLSLYPNPLFSSRITLHSSSTSYLFSHQVHYTPHTITRETYVGYVDCLRDTRVRCVLMEGWLSEVKEIDAKMNEHALKEQRVSVDVEEVHTVSEFSSKQMLAAAGKSHHHSSHTANDTPSLHHLPSTSTSSLLPNPLHQRHRIIASIPAPDLGSELNVSGTRHWTLLLYVWSSEIGREDNGGQNVYDMAAARESLMTPELFKDRAESGGSGGEDDNTPASFEYNPRPPRQYRCVLSHRIYAGTQEQEIAPLPTPAPTTRRGV